MSQILQSVNYAGAGGHLFLSEELSDVTILVQKGEQSQWRFPVHHLVLASQSEVFRRMLEDDFSEKKTGCIVIEDIKPKIVELLLGYIYQGRVNLENWHDTLELLRAAHKYQVDPLVQYCTRFLENALSISNVCSIYNESFVYSLTSLKEKCVSLIVDAGFILLRSKAFEILSKEPVMDIITHPKLNIDNELELYYALRRWAHMQCCRTGIQITEENIMQELTPFLKYICLDDMSDTEKSEIPAAVLSCVKSNNRNRIAPCVPETLLHHSRCFDFCAELDSLEGVDEYMICTLFSVDSSQFIIGLKFMIIATEFPSHLPLSLGKERNGTLINLFSVNLYSATREEGLQIMERKRFEVQLLLRTPWRLEAKTVYGLHIADRTQTVYCPRTKLLEKTLLTDMGHVNLSLHSESTFGLMGLIVI